LPNWRSHELESLIGGPLDSSGITEDALHRLVREPATESEQLDFKGGIYRQSKGPRPSWTPEQEFAKDVAALANRRGGLILLGVAEADGVAKELQPLTVMSADDEERRLRQALLNYQAPLADCWFVWIDATGGGRYCAVIVPPSRRSPHAVAGDPGEGRRALRYPVRHGRETMWLTESEVAEMYRRRQSAQEDEVLRVRRVVTDGCRMIREAAVGVWLFVAVVPESQVEGSLDRQTVDSIWTWQRQNGFSSPLGRDLGTYGQPIPAPGRVTFTNSTRTSTEDETEIRDGYLELHVDGSAFAATSIAQRTDGDGKGRDIGEFTIVDDGIILGDVATRWCAHQVGSWGTATAVMGLVDADDPDGVIQEPVVIVQHDTGQVRRMPATRKVRGLPETQVVLDLAATDAVQQRLAVTYRLLAGLLSWFGLAEPAQIKPNGMIATQQFLISQRRVVTTWCEWHGVEIERQPGV
jgi:hypothetical protein